MARCCEGKNAYKPISKTRYLLGFIIFYAMHIQCVLLIFLRHFFIKRYTHYRILLQFYKTYLDDTVGEIKERKGLVIRNQRFSTK